MEKEIEKLYHLFRCIIGSLVATLNFQVATEFFKKTTDNFKKATNFFKKTT